VNDFWAEQPRTHPLGRQRVPRHCLRDFHELCVGQPTTRERTRPPRSMSDTTGVLFPT
jgi:hypothetical protein